MQTILEHTFPEIVSEVKTEECDQIFLTPLINIISTPKPAQLSVCHSLRLFLTFFVSKHSNLLTQAMLRKLTQAIFVSPPY